MPVPERIVTKKTCGGTITQRETLSSGNRWIPDNTRTITRKTCGGTITQRETLSSGNRWKLDNTRKR